MPPNHIFTNPIIYKDGETLRIRHFGEEKLRARVPRVEQTSGTETDTANWTYSTPTILENLFLGVSLS
ncbi:hypothetical protein [Brunnivagina elsteri]|uniref:Uncharacterized protein n=1 Tax=Brunnivagina elsteri CCALA 953 TaxID=987040 RepID=A0A2A2TD85_9CYAN|nr:hypothetical protein [Calothrix elsteri]PAX51673.1 hypothetical protein CK510_23515 [Calothrix elsteri CCALA 953]